MGALYGVVPRAKTALGLTDLNINVLVSKL